MPDPTTSADARIYGVDLFGEPMRPAPVKSPVAQKFILPPFTVLSARDGAWQDRKRAWLSVGIKSELGRGAALLQLSDSCEEFRDRSGEFSSNAGNLTYKGKEAADIGYYQKLEKQKEEEELRAKLPGNGASHARDLTYTGAAAEFDYYRDREKAKPKGLAPGGQGGPEFML
jgi:hypothetical protein